MSEEEIVFQLLEEDRRLRLERIVGERKITTDDCLVLGILRLHREIGGLHEEIGGLREEIGGLHEEIGGLREEIGGLHKRIDDTNVRIDNMNARIADTNARIEELRIDMNRRIDSNFKWTVSLILGTWASMMAILIPILLKVVA
jgi:uncharacterized coiled-coil DUF342 family protein